jgi:hypothetical protein
MFSNSTIFFSWKIDKKRKKKKEKEREHMASRNEKREARHNGEDKPAERGLRWLCFNSSTFS